MVRDPERVLMHRLREALRGQQLRHLEQRRPRQFEGLRGEVLNDVLNDALAKHVDALERTLLMGALAGATWTADRAYRRGLRTDPNCPYCGLGVVEDQDHLLWGCSAWAVVREPMAVRLVETARTEVPWTPLDPEEWPPCLRLCCLPPVHLLRGTTAEATRRFVGLQCFAGS